MLILLPPSEGKSAPGRGRPLELKTLSLPSLTPARERVLDALVELCRDHPDHAATVLGLSRTQLDLVARNAALTDAPTARADRIYDGVLYEALSLASLSPSGKRRAASRVAITSSLFGLVRVGDRIPAYRLSGDACMPGLGPVAGWWRESLGPAMSRRDGQRACWWTCGRACTPASGGRPPSWRRGSRPCGCCTRSPVGGRW